MPSKKYILTKIFNFPWNKGYDDLQFEDEEEEDDDTSLPSVAVKYHHPLPYHLRVNTI